MTFFPQIPYLFYIVTLAGTATVKISETQWDISAPAVAEGPGAEMVKDYLAVHGIGFHGQLFGLEAVSPEDLHHALTMNATTHHEPTIVSFEVIGYVPTESPSDEDDTRWADDEEED